MGAEHLHQLLHEAMWKEASDTTNWQKAIAIFQSAFRSGTLADKSTFNTVVLIPKGGSRNFRFIGLVYFL